MVVVAFLLIAADDASHTPEQRIQGTWVYPASLQKIEGTSATYEIPREVWTFEGDRWTFTGDAHRAAIITGGAGSVGVHFFHVPCAESWGRFRLVGTKAPRVIVLDHEHPKGLAPTETTYLFPDDDTFRYQ